jgi:hypothetical protein
MNPRQNTEATIDNSKKSNVRQKEFIIPVNRPKTVTKSFNISVKYFDPISPTSHNFGSI